MTEAEARKRHPAGKQFIPKVALLERLLMVIRDNHWAYGVPTRDAPNRLERWDLRSVLDYAVASLTHNHASSATSAPISFGLFYLWREAIMSMLMEMAELPNYGEWRFWETDENRTYMDIERVVVCVLEAEKARTAK